MANPGEIEYKYRRNYIATNPDPSQGPITWRLASPEITAGEGGNFVFEGTDPITVTTDEFAGPGGATVITTSLDVSELDIPSDTDDLTEGSTNKYFPEAPVDGKQYARKDASWSEVVAPDGNVPDTTDDLTEGTTNLYFPEAPDDGNKYVRQQKTWVQLPNTDDPDGDGAVDSVNGQTGVVVLGIQDMDDYDGTTDLADGDILSWDASDEKFKPVQPSQGGGGSGAEELNDLSDVDLTVAPTAGQYLAYDAGSSTFKPATLPSSGGGTGDGSVTTVKGTSPIQSDEDATTPTISVLEATTSTDGVVNRLATGADVSSAGTGDNKAVVTADLLKATNVKVESVEGDISTINQEIININNEIDNIDGGGASLPAGSVGQVLMYSGSAWAGSLVIDCGAKDLGGSQEDYPD